MYVCVWVRSADREVVVRHRASVHYVKLCATKPLAFIGLLGLLGFIMVMPSYMGYKLLECVAS